MPRPRFLNDTFTSSPPPPQKIGILFINSDFIVILVALLCAVTCVIALVTVARCTWIRRLSGRDDEHGASSSPVHSLGNKGMKKKILKALKKTAYRDCDRNKCSSDCAICLAEYVDGDEIRLLPECGHVFHVGCIDKWLGSHSSCPTCRRIFGVERCEKCGDLTVASPISLDFRVETPVVVSTSS